MNTTFEPRSNIKSSNVWNSPFKKSKKLLWNFQSKKSRGDLPEIAPVIRNRGMVNGVRTYSFGQYVGPLDDLKHFAKLKGFKELTMGAIKMKLA